MKLLLYYIKSIWFYFFGNKIDKLNLKLQKAAIDATKTRYELKKTISDDLNRAFGIQFSKRSKFIPTKGHNPMKIYKYVMTWFGQDLSKNNIKLTKDLIWK